MVLSKKYEGISVEGVKNKLGPKIRVQYSLYVGDEKDIIHTIWLRVPENITVYEVMQLAQVADNKYKFQWKKMGEKLYIYDIDNITNDFENGQFWLLYLGQNKESMTHLTESPDKIVISTPHTTKFSKVRIKNIVSASLDHGRHFRSPRDIPICNLTIVRNIPHRTKFSNVRSKHVVSAGLHSRRYFRSPRDMPVSAQPSSRRISQIPLERLPDFPETWTKGCTSGASKSDVGNTV
ncbi:uncharacterized protein CG3556 [Caerostris extrusa]|uniref:Uncharacterized protein CG3556 n=1 Tax=Caerostris extrusa TaxID=172846 RepID=A0AAV4XK74_CAEEX|nr:uncharacterized protein CG3556 [Caerostris extrusa]